MEAENYLSGGYGIRLAMDARKVGRGQLGDLATVWQPNRLKGTLVSKEYGTPFLAATQVFDLRPAPRKYLSLDQIKNASDLKVHDGQILVTRSGSVGRATLAHKPHQGVIISDDLLRVDAKAEKHWGWVYAYLRSPQGRAMMTAAQYGHIIKHLEVGHLSSLPIPMLRDDLLRDLNAKVKKILKMRIEADTMFTDAEALFEKSVGLPVDVSDIGENGFSVSARNLFSGRRRIEGFFHNPAVRNIRAHFAARGLKSTPLVQGGFDVWLPTRFRRIPAPEGVEFVDSSDLFEINPDITKRIADGAFGDRNKGRVKAGWLLLARSGQIYGLNGTLRLANEAHEGKVISDHVIRIAPNKKQAMRAAYVHVALSHPTLGRPLVKSLAYGSSIPEIEVADMERIEVVRLRASEEDAIADLAERGSALQAKADILEVGIAAEAEGLIDQFLAGDTTAFIVP